MRATTRGPAVSPDEIRARFRAARRMPQMLEIQDQTRIALRQVSDAMDEEDGGDSDAELLALFTALKGLLDEITGRIQRQATVDDLERRMQGGTPLRDGAERDFQRQCCEFSLFRAAAHAIGIQGVDAGRELEVQAELIRRSGGRAFTGNVVMPIEALAVQVRHLSGQQRARLLETRQDPIGVNQPPGTTGGSLVATFTDPNQYIDILRATPVVRQAGARVISDMRDNLRLPRLTRSGTPGWFMENSPIPRTEQRFDDITMVPHHDGAIVEITRQALQQANPDVEAIVRNDLALQLANDVDVTALAGSGVAPQPLGIIRDGDVPNLPEAPLDYDGIVDMIGGLANKNALNGSLGFVGDSTVMTTAMKLKDAMERPYGALLWHDYGTYWTNLASFATAPASPLVFGNWADLIIGFWSELDVLVNPYETSAYSKGNVLIRCAMTLDIARRHPESFIWRSMIPAPEVNGRTAPHPAPDSAPPRPSPPRAPSRPS